MISPSLARLVAVFTGLVAAVALTACAAPARPSSITLERGALELRAANGGGAAEPSAAAGDDPAGDDVEPEILERRRGGKYDGRTPVRDAIEGTKLYWDQGLRLDMFDGDLSIVLGGRLHIDGAGFDENSELEEDFGEVDSDSEVRRALLEFAGLYRERFEGRVTVDVSGTDEVRDLLKPVDDVTFRDVFLGVTKIPVVGTVRGGYLKEPFGLEQIESSNSITFMERSLTDALIARRNLGLLVQRPVAERRGTGSFGVFRQMNNDLDVGDGFAVTGRATALPVYVGDGRRLVHLGAGLSYREPGDEGLRYLSRPEANIGDVLVDTGFIAAHRAVRGGIEAAYLDGPFSVQGEAMVSAVDGIGSVGDPVFPAAYLMTSYVLTGERRRYRRNVGAFGTVFPDSDWGAWEAVARYSYLDLDSEGIDGGVLHGVTLGANWYITDYGRIMINYVSAHPEGSGVQRIGQIRLQINI